MVRKSQEITFALKGFGIEVDDVQVHADRVVIKYGGDMSFEKLDRIAGYFGTKQIDMGISRGCASDPSVEPYIIIWTSSRPFS